MKNPIRSRFIFAFTIVMGMMLAACSAKHENPLVGKWKTSQNGGTDAMLTFTSDGKVLGEGRKPLNGEYALSGSNTVIMKIATNSIEFSLSFNSPDEITLAPKTLNGMPVPASQAPPAKFTRVSR